MIDVEVDLRAAFGPVRDQGARPTCLAFAASDTHAGLRDGWTALSAEYAFYHAQRRAARPPSSGAVLRSMLEALRIDGQPAEDQWPYLVATPEAQSWAPPANLSPLYARNGLAAGGDVGEIRASLDDGVPVIVLMTLSKSFFLPSQGGLVDAAPGELPEPSQRHAVIAVGHGRSEGERVILIRNSWGASWGDGGHAWLTERYLTPRIFASALLLEDLSVSASSIAA